MVEAAGQSFHIFRCGLDYAFIQPKQCAGCGAYYPSEQIIRQILVLALHLLGEPMSLYRAGLRLAPFLPLGVAIAVSALGFTDVSPVFTLPLRAEATLLIEPASASPLPSGSTCVVCLCI